jgi:hypothetical protein
MYSHCPRVWNRYRERAQIIAKNGFRGHPAWLINPGKEMILSCSNDAVAEEAKRWARLLADVTRSAGFSLIPQIGDGSKRLGISSSVVVLKET